MDGISQDRRLLTLHTPLGDNALLLERMDGTESLSSLYAYTLDVRSFSDSIEPAQLIHKPVNWNLRCQDESLRPFHGLVASFSGGEAISRQQRSFSLTVVPWLWFLQHRQDCRVFQNKTVIDIAKQIFSELGFNDYDTSGLAQTYQPRVYCVQYRESDFNFVSRLFEEEGIFYYFKHETGRHVLMLADGAHAYRDSPDSPLPYNPPGIFKNSVTRWSHHQTFRSGRSASNSYNFQNPGASLQTSTNGTSPVPAADAYEIYDPAQYGHRDRGEGVSNRLIASHEKGQDMISAACNSRHLGPAQRFMLEAHPIASEAGSYVVVSITHHATASSYESVAKGAPSYGNSLDCMPSSVSFVPEQRSEKPVIPGMQSAVVTGPQGEEIYTDQYGRVKVKFHWDRKGQSNETSSCWLRVSQPWAGRGYGGQTIPRIGMEVLVTFLDGNPDEPVVVGAMPNAQTTNPLNLPAEKERTTMKSASSPGGNGFNELTFEDKAGLEEVFLHGQQDFSQIVKRNKMTDVGNAHTTTTQTLWSSMVGGSLIEKTQQHVLIRHGNSQIFLDANGIRIAYGAGHVLVLDASGIRLHSTAQVAASQSGSSYVRVDGGGVTTEGGTITSTTTGGSKIVQTGGTIDLNPG